MFIRTYIRTILNNFIKKNFILILISKIVNFYCNLWNRNIKTIKFTSNMSINELREKKSISFQSVTGDKIDCK